MIYVGRASDAAGGVLSLTVRSAMMAKTHVVNDYLPSHPKLDLAGQATVDVPFGGEIIDFGPGSSPRRRARTWRRCALSPARARDGVEGESDLTDIQAARTIAVDGHPHVGPERLLVVWVEHLLTQPTQVMGMPTPFWATQNKIPAIGRTASTAPRCERRAPGSRAS